MSGSTGRDARYAQQARSQMRVELRQKRQAKDDQPEPSQALRCPTARSTPGQERRTNPLHLYMMRRRRRNTEPHRHRRREPARQTQHRCASPHSGRTKPGRSMQLSRNLVLGARTKEHPRRSRCRCPHRQRAYHQKGQSSPNPSKRDGETQGHSGRRTDGMPPDQGRIGPQDPHQAPTQANAPRSSPPQRP